MENTNVKITAIPNGPLMVEGTIHVTKGDWVTETKEQKSFLCRCGIQPTNHIAMVLIRRAILPAN